MKQEFKLTELEERVEFCDCPSGFIPSNDKTYCIEEAEASDWGEQETVDCNDNASFFKSFF